MLAIWILGLLLILMVASNVAMAWYLFAHGERLNAVETELASLQDRLKAKKPRKKNLPIVGRLP
jgi:hypothetical protein